MYNIFKIIGIQTHDGLDEVTVCKIFADLLNPKGEHGQKFLYLMLFDKHILKLNIPNYELSFAEIKREFTVSISDNVLNFAKRRRIDLVITTENYFVALEIKSKVSTPDSDCQCYDYYQAILKQPQFVKQLYYLTLEGRKPPCNSNRAQDKNKRLPENVPICISFCEDILNWLNDCYKYTPNEVPSVKNMILQLSDSIKAVTESIQLRLPL